MATLRPLELREARARAKAGALERLASHPSAASPAPTTATR